MFCCSRQQHVQACVIMYNVNVFSLSFLIEPNGFSDFRRHFRIQQGEVLVYTPEIQGSTSAKFIHGAVVAHHSSQLLCPLCGRNPHRVVNVRGSCYTVLCLFRKKAPHAQKEERTLWVACPGLPGKRSIIR
jgi:hypothetical protein